MSSHPVVFSPSAFGNILLLAALFVAIWILLWYVSRRFDGLVQSRPRTRSLCRALETAARILLWLGALLFAARLLAPSTNAFLIAIGSAAVAIGLGARDLIRNLIGGLMIITGRPFEVGDRVTIAEASGEIHHIGLYSTKIMTADGALVTVPNANLMDGIAHNTNAGLPECAVVAEVLLPADTDPDLALRVGREVLITSPYLCLGRRTAVALTDIYSQTPCMGLKLEGYVYNHRFESEMSTDLIRRCKAEFRRLGVLRSHAATP